MRKLAIALPIALLPSFAVAESGGHMAGHMGGPVHGFHSGFHFVAPSNRHARLIRHHRTFVQWPLYGYGGTYAVPSYPADDTSYPPDDVGAEPAPDKVTQDPAPVPTPAPARSVGCQQQVVPVDSEDGGNRAVTIFRC
jgi:hypothetical protein